MRTRECGTAETGATGGRVLRMPPVRERVRALPALVLAERGLEAPQGVPQPPPGCISPLAPELAQVNIGHGALFNDTATS